MKSTHQKMSAAKPSKASELPHDVIGVIATFAATSATDALVMCRASKRWYEAYLACDDIWEHLSMLRWGGTGGKSTADAFFVNRVSCADVQKTGAEDDDEDDDDDESKGTVLDCERYGLTKLQRRPVRFTLELFRHRVATEAKFKPLPPKYLHPIEECDLYFQCPLFAEHLRPMPGRPQNFFCDECKQEVFQVRTQGELDDCTDKGRCVWVYETDVMKQQPRITPIHLYYYDDESTRDDHAKERNVEDGSLRRARFILSALKNAGITSMEQHGTTHTSLRAPQGVGFFGSGVFPELTLYGPDKRKGFRIEAINVAKVSAGQKIEQVPSFCIVLGGAPTLRRLRNKQLAEHVQVLSKCAAVLSLDDSDAAMIEPSFLLQNRDASVPAFRDLARRIAPQTAAAIATMSDEELLAHLKEAARPGANCIVDAVGSRKLQGDVNLNLCSSGLIDHLWQSFLKPRMIRGKKRR